jgi:uncharacterized protein (TIGR03437 family)
VRALGLDGEGSVFVAGSTDSADFPVTEDGYQQELGAGISSSLPCACYNGFLMKFSSDGWLTYSTYIGGQVLGGVTQLKLGGSGEAYLNHQGAPPSESARCASGPDVWVLNPERSTLHVLPLAGSLMSLDGMGNLYTAGVTEWSPKIFPTADAMQAARGGWDGFLMKSNLDVEGSAVTCVVNAATQRYASEQNRLGAVAPGEVISIYGLGLGTETKVWFDDAPAWIIYPVEGRIDTVVPFGVTGPATRLRVETLGRRTVTQIVAVTDISPGIFRIDGSGIGPAIVRNEDGTANSMTAAARGTVISLEATGFGPMDPPQADGEITSIEPPWPRTQAPLTARFGEYSAEVVHGGAAPGKVAGLLRIDIRVPEEMPPGQQWLSLRIGDVPVPSVLVNVK